MDGRFMQDLQGFRDFCGFPFTVVSGFRCHEHNIAVGGEKDSMHLVGRAADIRFHDGIELYRLIKMAPLYFKGIGLNDGSVHVDNRDNEVAFTYYKNYVKKSV